MPDLKVVTYLWGDKYGPEDVGKVYRGFQRHLEEPHRFVVVTDEPSKFRGHLGFEVVRLPREDRYLTEIKGCFARLRLFDPEFQKDIGVDQRLVCVDLDVVVTGPLFPLFCGTETFKIVKGANAANPCPMNGSLWMLRAGYEPDVWTSFSVEAARRTTFHSFPDDQGWFWSRMPDAPGWNVGSESGVYAFQKPGWPGLDKRGNELPHKMVTSGHVRAKEFHGKYRDELPKDARIVVFPGWRSPAQFQGLDWVREHWR